MAYNDNVCYRTSLRHITTTEDTQPVYGIQRQRRLQDQLTVHHIHRFHNHFYPSYIWEDCHRATDTVSSDMSLKSLVWSRLKLTIN